MPFVFDYFSNNLARWNKHVKPRKPMRSLVIGCHEGRAPLWLLENVPGSSIICIDNFDKHKPIIFGNFQANITPYKSRVKTYNMSHRDALIKIASIPNLQLFDFIFIDTVDSKEVLENLILAFPLLKPKGLLIVDDYTNSKEHLPNCPKVAIDSFMNIYAPFVKALEFSWQAILLKRSRKLSWPKCNSEYYHENLKTI